MKKDDIRFIISLITLLVYEVALIVFALDGVTPSKLFFTGLVWISFFIAGYEFILKKNILKKNIPSSANILLTLLLTWNVFNIIRSLVRGDGSITTILGNVAGALSVLIPFVIIFSVAPRNLKIIHTIFSKVLKFSIPIFLLLFLLNGASLSDIQLRFLLVLFLPVVFLITGLPYYAKKDKILVLISAILLVGLASMHSVRTMMIREVLLFIALIAVFLDIRFKQRWILSISCLFLLVPIIILQQGYVSGESPFETFLSGSDDSDLSVDTRTFLYLELFEDLRNTDKLVVGKGANGSYFSEYFNSVNEGETDNRNNIEVGFLGILLKGGLIAVFLNFGLLFIAIYMAFFKSNNSYTVGVGYILLIHTALLFLENYVVYSEYNFAIWFFTGIGLSKRIRSISDKEIKMLIQGKKKLR